MKMIETGIVGCYQVCPVVHDDLRGRFVKVFSGALYREHGLVSEFCEEYYSVSHRGVLRGMHFQVPPQDHEKLVYSISGEVLDVVVDLRQGSPSYHKCISVRLNSDNCHAMYIPRGCAHGFLTLSDSATLVYKTSTEYAPDLDQGVLWSSLPFEWPDQAPVLSDRDKAFEALDQYTSPFQYGDQQ